MLNIIVENWEQNTHQSSGVCQILLNALLLIVSLCCFDSWDRKNNPYPWQKIKHNERLKVGLNIHDRKKKKNMHGLYF